MHWLRSLFHRRQIYSDLSEKIQQHLAEKLKPSWLAGWVAKTPTAYNRSPAETIFAFRKCAIGQTMKVFDQRIDPRRQMQAA
jgi:hypothetical protein